MSNSQFAVLIATIYLARHMKPVPSIILGCAWVVVSVVHHFYG